MVVALHASRIHLQLTRSIQVDAHGFAMLRLRGHGSGREELAGSDRLAER